MCLTFFKCTSDWLYVMPQRPCRTEKCAAELDECTIWQLCQITSATSFGIPLEILM